MVGEAWLRGAFISDACTHTCACTGFRGEMYAVLGPGQPSYTKQGGLPSRREQLCWGSELNWGLRGWNA